MHNKAYIGIMVSFIIGTSSLGCGLKSFVKQATNPFRKEAKNNSNKTDIKENGKPGKEIYQTERVDNKSNQRVIADSKKSNNRESEEQKIIVIDDDKSAQEGKSAAIPLHKNISPEREVFDEKIKDLVKQVAQGLPEDGKVRLSITDFPNFTGESTLFTKFLTEELTTLFSLNPRFEIVDTLHQVPNALTIASNPLEGAYEGGDALGSDVVITGTIIDLGDTVKINARLISRRTGVVITATSISLLKDKVIEGLMGKKYEGPMSRPLQNDLYSQMDELVRQMVKNLSEDKKYKIVLLKFTDIKGESTALSEFLSGEVVNRLFTFTEFEIVDGSVANRSSSKNNPFLTDVPSNGTSKNLDNFFQVDTIVKGVATDLGSIVRLNVHLLNADTGSIVGVAAVDLRKEETVAKLLGEKSSEKTQQAVTTKTIKEEKRTGNEDENKKLGSYSPMDNVFFRKDFFEYGDGQPALDWGKGLVVKKDGNNKHFLTSVKDEFLIARQAIPFPEEFSFEFEVKGNSEYWSSVRFHDKEKNEFEVTFKIFDDILYITLPGPKMVKTKVGTDEFNKIKIIKKNKLYELHSNDTLLLVGTYSKYKSFESFELHSAFSKFQFANFIGRNLQS